VRGRVRRVLSFEVGVRFLGFSFDVAQDRAREGTSAFSSAVED